MNLGLGFDDVLTTTRAVRKRLDFDRPVERQLLLECLDLAVQAPNIGNEQTWSWLFVDDQRKKDALANLYGRALRVVAPRDDNLVDNHGLDLSDPATQRLITNTYYLADHLAEVPVLLVPCAAGRPPAELAHAVSFWGNLMPATWSFCLAARSRGLGTVWTTIHLLFEEEAAEILGIPFGDVTQGGIIPVAHTKGSDFKRAARKSAAEVARWNQW